jgi:hypothetical protein
MDDDRIDFSALDPTQDRVRFDELVASIMEKAEAELGVRRASTNPLSQLVQWRRPMLAAAAVIAMVSVGILWQVQVPELEEESTGIAEAIGVPNLLAQGIRNNDMPTTAELFEAFQEIQ